jgi:hypothetical protein
MTRYNVHIYREMLLRFDGIEADSPEQAAEKARDMHFDDASDWSDCEGDTLAALTDVVGDEDYGDSKMIDFEPGRMLKAAPGLLDALRTVVEMEYDRDEESRNFDEERLACWSGLITKAEGRAA